jgi:hypothetical protein
MTQFFRRMKILTPLKLTYCILIVVLVNYSCTHHAIPAASPEIQKKSMIAISSPPCIIYHTRADYSMYVPVTLSPDKSKIVSYPDVKDLYYNGKFSLPTLLDSGFLLDNRGINLSVAFLDYTYEEYSKLYVTPNANDLFSLIMDKDPLVEMYQCGLRSQYNDIEIELDNIINAGKLNTCKRLK